MHIHLLFPILVIFAACFVLALFATKKGGTRTGTYRRRKLMTDNEEEFFGRLVAALPDHYVFPQVAMSAMLQPASGNGRTAHSDRLRIAQQRVDYVVCTKRCEVVAVVELDDRTHSRAKDQLRDARLEQGGIRTIRFQSRAKPKVDAIRALVLGSAVTGGSGSRNGLPPAAVGSSADPVDAKSRSGTVHLHEASARPPMVPSHDGEATRFRPGS